MEHSRLAKITAGATLLVAVLVVTLLFIDRGAGNQSDLKPNSDPRLIAQIGLEIDPATSTHIIIDRRQTGRTGGIGFVSQAFADDEVNINPELELTNLQFPPPGATPQGLVFPITATLENVGKEVLTTIFFRVAVLEYVSGGEPLPELTNATRGGSGVGAEIDAVLLNGNLAVGESFDVTFDILVPRIERFVFFVDAFSIPPIVVPDDPTPTPTPPPSPTLPPTPTPPPTPPPTPTLLAPGNGSIVEGVQSFVWSEVDDPSGVPNYQIQVDDDGDFSSPEIDIVVDSTGFNVPDGQELPPGDYFWRVRAQDGAGNLGDFSEPNTFSIPEPPPDLLASIIVFPGGFRFTELDIERPITVTGVSESGATENITPASTGTTYKSSNHFVASVNDEGIVTSVANGSATITVTHENLITTVAIAVEVGVELESIDLSPLDTTLRLRGAIQQLSVTGEFSDGSIRDLTSTETGTLYESQDLSVVTVSLNGLVTAVSNGSTAIVATNESFSNEMSVTVAISGGPGFLRGEVYNDTLGLPLIDATVMLLEDGSGPLTNPIEVTTDGRGQYLLPGFEGDSLVLIERDGFTSVARRGSIPADTARTLLDARLTPLDLKASAISSAIGGVATDASGEVSLDFPPGSVASDTDIRLTPISNQGLQGRLPLGWSPVAAVDVQPYGLEFAQPPTLQIPNELGLPPNTELTAVLYDVELHTWIARGTATVTPDGAHIEHLISTSGQVALLLPDAPPFAPPSPIDGSVLLGTSAEPIPDGASATGEVVPRSAPPGEGAKATGEVVLESPSPLPSGTHVQAHVRERFDLFAGSSVVPVRFVQDLVLYAQPPTGNPNALGTKFPITPSLSFSIHELALGVVQIDVKGLAPDVGGTVVGSAGGEVVSDSGDAALISAGALASDTIVDLFTLAADELPVDIPGSVELLGAMLLELGGTQLSQSAQLSIGKPDAVGVNSQVIVAQVISDPFNIRRLRIIGLGQVDGDRIVSQDSLNGLALPGVTTRGIYVFLQPTVPFGFVTGEVFAPLGGIRQTDAVVTADSAPFADVTGLDGTYLIAGQAGVETVITAIDGATRNIASNTIVIPGANDIVALDLVLGVTAPTVVDTTPATDDTDVPLNTSVVVEFSTSIDPATITSDSVVLRINGAIVTGQRTVSADGRKATLVPDVALESLTEYTLTLTDDITDLSGNTLVPFAMSFTTLDTSKPPQPVAGQIIAELPDEDGVVLLFGTQGTSEPDSGVTATNLRSQETFTVLADTSGAFRIRVLAELGDELALTLRNAEGQDQTISITQFEGPDGSTSVGVKGGTIADSEGRIATILPRALTEAGVFKLEALTDQSKLPTLPADFAYVDAFSFSNEGGVFNRLQSLTLTERQARFAPQTATSAPFTTTGLLIVPPDFLINGKLNFSAVAEDAGGNRNSVSGSTLVVASSPSNLVIEEQSFAQFPIVFLEAPEEALPNQQVEVNATAPAARADFQLPVPTGVSDDTPLLLGRVSQLNGDTVLSIVDQLELTEIDGSPALVTSGRELPGAASGGEYAVVSSAVQLAFATGQITGPAQTVSVEGLPFVFEATEPNARFIVPVLAGQPFVLNFVDPATGQITESVSGDAPAEGAIDLGQPLSVEAGLLQVTALPNENSLVDIGDAIVFDFSEPIDTRTLTIDTIIVTDSLGSRVFGRFDVSSDSTKVTFTPNRRWRFGETYFYGVSTNILAVSGARLQTTFSRSFTTFDPSVLNSVDVDNARDIAISNGIAVVGGSSGLSVLDIANAADPSLLAQVLAEGGVSGVTIVTDANFGDRNGDNVAGTLVLAATGDEDSVGSLNVFDLNNPNAPALIGSTQLTTPQGQAAPNGVPDAPGTPNAVVLGSDLRAIVAVQDIGVQTVDLTQAIPADPGNPGGALGPRFPAAQFEGANGIAVIGNDFVVVGVEGLTLLNGNTFEALGNISTTGEARGVATLEAFRMDINGDGVIDSATEVFDVAFVANGEDGTLQFIDLSDATEPTLISVVRLQGEANSVVVSPDENLAYVSAGPNGVAIVDLSGPANIQPLDVDRNGVDDRILGVINTPGLANRIALDLPQGIGYIADGPSGLTVVQLIPARAKITDVLRDPVAASIGDEQSIANSGEAFLSDDAIQIELNAVIPPRVTVFLTIEERPVGDGPSILTFPNGGISAQLVSGPNTLTINLNKDLASNGSQASLKVQESGGGVIAVFELNLTEAVIGDAVLESLVVAPQSIVIAEDEETTQLSVAGVFSDGRTLNLTSSSAGTTYSIGDSFVASVNAEGLVTGLAGGIINVFALNSELAVAATIEVQKPTVLTSIEATEPFVTLVASGAQRQLVVEGVFSDRTVQDVAQGFGTQFVAANPDVVSVTADGVLIATGEGVTTVAVTNSEFEDVVNVAVEFRVTPDLSSIDLDPFTNLVKAEVGETVARALVGGTGSLEGLEVTFAVDGSGEDFVGTTDYSGAAVVIITGLTTIGDVTVTASVVNPTGGSVLSDSETLTVEQAPGDNEPNDDLAAASRVATGNEFNPSPAVNGRLNSILGDFKDNFALDLESAGTLAVNLVLHGDAVLEDIDIVVLSEDGVELGRFTPTSFNSTLTQEVDGDSFVTLEVVDGFVSYTLSTSFERTSLEITSVSPTSGGPGTEVTIDGSGFSIEPSDNLVLFSNVSAKITSASATQLKALVPANAVNGPLKVIAGSQEAIGPEFDVGNASPLPPATIPPFDPDVLRLDPITGELFEVNILLVNVDPTVARAEVEALASSMGGDVTGLLPLSSTYVLSFPAINTIAGLEATRRQLEADGRVTSARRDLVPEDLEGAERIDSRDFDLVDVENWVIISRADTGIALRRTNIFEAIEKIRKTPPFDNPTNFKQVSVAVIDRGFDPKKLAEEFQYSDSTEAVDLFVASNCDASTCQMEEADVLFDSNGHGTKVTSVIAALNNNRGMSGVLASLYQPGEETQAKQNIHVRVYARDSLRSILAALSDITLPSVGDIVDFDVVNMSFVWVQATSANSAFNSCKDDFKFYINLNLKTLFVIAGGNSHVSSDFWCPQSLSNKNNVMTIGSVGVIKRQKRDSGRDVRSSFSNFGTAITMAAPGEYILAATKETETASGYSRNRGTSYAAPMVAGVAAILQAISPGNQKFFPIELKRILTGTGTQLTDLWNQAPQPANFVEATATNPMSRLNALAAVESVLPNPTGTVYVADQKLDKVFAIEVDHLTGDPKKVQEIHLTFTQDDGVFVAAFDPTSVAVSPLGDELYVVVKTSDSDGVVVINTSSKKAVNFIPTGDVPIRRTGIVFSQDGRLVYVATGKRITIINTIERKVVASFADLPHTYDDLEAGQQDSLSDRLSSLESALAGATIDPGTVLSDLAISPDGKTLYAVMETGGGGGRQPGAVIPINVDLYTDADSDAPGLQSNLDNYFKVTGTIMKLAGAGTFGGGDEPKAVAVSPDGKRVYLAHGGINFFQGVPPIEVDVFKYQGLLNASLMAAATISLFPGAASFSQVESLFGASSTVFDLTSFPTAAAGIFTAVMQQAANEVNEAAKSGVTLLSAPGYTGVFDSDGAQEWLFPSNVVQAWNPDGGKVINQFSFRHVYAKRPFDMAIRPDGKRALIAYFQTGNFGVLDTKAQSSPNFAVSASVSDDTFAAVVGVTPSIRLDNHLWPLRGVARIAGNTPLPSPDENLLFTWDVEYAQNGRFAVATHSGTRSPNLLNVTITADCDFDPNAMFRLAEISLTCDDTGLPFTFQRGGGAISIINDKAITDDFDTHLDEKTSISGTERPYYSTIPVCKEVELLGGTVPRRVCAEEAVTHVYGFVGNDQFNTSIDQATSSSAGLEVWFTRPRGVAIQPIVTIESPRFGDFVGFGTGVQTTWLDDSITGVRFSFYELDPDEPNPVFKGDTPEFDLNQPAVPGQTTPKFKDIQSFARAFGRMFKQATSDNPEEGKRYRVEVRICDSATSCTRPNPDVPTSVENSFSKTHVDVTFEGASGGEVTNVVVIIPGIGGSVLKNAATGQELWIGLFANHNKLSLYDGEVLPNIVATDAVREVINVFNWVRLGKVYADLIDVIDGLTGFNEYQLAGNPDRLTDVGCDTTQIAQGSSNPNLFVFPYDWRKDNADNASGAAPSNSAGIRSLKEYMKCIQKFHPDTKVNIVAHSMGGLIARRYIIDNPGNHNVGKLITIGTPWLGAAKLIDSMTTGRFISLWLHRPPTIRHILGSFPGAQQLLPSKAFFELGGQPMGEAGRDWADGDATKGDKDPLNNGEPPDSNGEVLFPKLYTYEQMKFAMDSLYGTDRAGNPLTSPPDQIDLQLVGLGYPPPPPWPPEQPVPPGQSAEPGPPVQQFKPGTINDTFHQKPGQDNWKTDSSGVRYYHIYGEQKTDETTIRALSVPLTLIEKFFFNKGGVAGILFEAKGTKTIKGKGDKTVPLISAERIGNGKNYNAPGAELVKCKGVGSSTDKKVEHNGMVGFDEVHKWTIFFLGEAGTAPSGPICTSQPNNQ